MKSDEEREYIGRMLTAATAYGLEEEVVCELWRALKAEPDISIHEAVWNALYEWDLLGLGPRGRLVIPK